MFGQIKGKLIEYPLTDQSSSVKQTWQQLRTKYKNIFLHFQHH